MTREEVEKLLELESKQNEIDHYTDFKIEVRNLIRPLCLDWLRLKEENEKLRRLLKSLINNWYEFGPDGGFDEKICHADHILKRKFQMILSAETGEWIQNKIKELKNTFKLRSQSSNVFRLWIKECK